MNRPKHPGGTSVVSSEVADERKQVQKAIHRHLFERTTKSLCCTRGGFKATTWLIAPNGAHHSGSVLQTNAVHP
jgi:hypothetical protein